MPICDYVPLHNKLLNECGIHLLLYPKFSSEVYLSFAISYNLNLLILLLHPMNMIIVSSMQLYERVMEK